MALQSPFSSSSLNFTWKYDVFISFRGQDTRYGFTGNLYKALCDKGIHTFFDDDKLLSGEEITPAIIKAIEESRIAIVVLSPNYASSSFCLDELVHVLHCIKGNNRLVLPVFYEMDPSDVRHLKNSFGEAMAKHENRYKDHMNNKVDKWKKALKEVANLSGYHFKHRNGYEHMFIGNIVDNISKRIRRHSTLLVADHPVGLESPVSEVASLLDVNSSAEVRMVGIHGIGGIGKTTVATAVYNLIADHFEGYESIENLLQAHYGRCMQYHIGVLGEKSLIRIDWCNNRVTMHDLIVDMGKEIVLEESPKIPGKRSRLWFYKDIVKVFEDNQGTSAIEIIYLERDVEVKWDGTTFKDMKNLKTLVIKNGCFSESPKHLPNSLRVLEWWKYPSKYFPHDFQPKELSILKLPHNIYMPPKLDSLSKKLVSLKVLNFDYCNSLNEIVDVSNLQTLQEFSFKRCKNLVTVHSSVGFLSKLKILNAEYCCKLRNFPPTINLPSLEKLLLSGCSSLKNFPEIPEEMKNLEVLYLHGTGIKDLPCSFRNFSGLFWLVMHENYKMCKIPSVIGMMPRLYHCDIVVGGNKGRVLGKQEEGLHGIHTNSLPSLNLKDLSLMNSNLSDDFFPLALAWFPNVASLKLSGNNFTVLPECIRKFQFLISLNMDHSKYLREIIGIPPNLKEFSAVNCKSLSPRGTSLLLNQKLHERGGTKFVMPGGKIPRWFEKRSRGASISFWFRGTIFPRHALCIAVLLTDDLPSPIGVRPIVSINGYQFLRGKWDTAMDQLFILNLSETNVYRCKCNVTQRFENKWNHAEVSYETLDYYTYGEVSSESIAKEIGMHVWKEESSSIMEGIRFTDPYKMTQVIIMMIMLSIAFPNHKNHPLLLQTCIGLWTLLFLTHTLFPAPTLYDLDDNCAIRIGRIGYQC
ncbi:TMV resistance protein N-like isoform X3 [Arachis stenosperma]|uniref:TMV resistance protein N-like isoform X3 n=1 Tax=Arachis stenosperma TaxID=217475 RepID=UPI0025AD1BB6|nr:TMV resistance protein N-like isoform X3 [Arachis stenosperma]